MANPERVVTSKLPGKLASKMDEIAARIEAARAGSRQSVAKWLAEEERRHELTLEALKSVDEGRTQYPHEEVPAGYGQLRCKSPIARRSPTAAPLQRTRAAWPALLEGHAIPRHERQCAPQRNF